MAVIATVYTGLNTHISEASRWLILRWRPYQCNPVLADVTMALVVLLVTNNKGEAMEVSLVIRLLIIAWIAKASKTSCTCHVYVCVTWLIHMRDSHMRYSHSRTDIDVHIYTATGTDTHSDRKCESDGGWLRLAFSIKLYMSNMNESVVPYLAQIPTWVSQHIHACDMTHSCACCDPFIRASRLCF